MLELDLAWDRDAHEGAATEHNLRVRVTARSDNGQSIHATSPAGLDPQLIARLSGLQNLGEVAASLSFKFFDGAEIIKVCRLQPDFVQLPVDTTVSIGVLRYDVPTDVLASIKIPRAPFRNPRNNLKSMVEVTVQAGADSKSEQGKILYTSDEKLLGKFNQGVPKARDAWPQLSEEVDKLVDGQTVDGLAPPDPAVSVQAAVTAAPSNDSLRTRIDKSAPLPADVLRALASIADGLRYMHDLGVAYGDLKPENILLVGEIWTIGDFAGIRLLDAPVAQSSPIQTAPRYPPPEASQGDDVPSAAADMWALGCILAEAATGRPLLTDGHTSRCDPEVPTDLPEPIRNCLTPDPKQRATAAQTYAALRTFEPRVPQPSVASDTSPPENIADEQTAAAPEAAPLVELPPSPIASPANISPLLEDPAGARPIPQTSHEQSPPAVQEITVDPRPVRRRLALFGITASIIALLSIGAYKKYEFAHLLPTSLPPTSGPTSPLSAPNPTPWKPSIAFAASRNHLTSGQSTTLSWSVQGAQRVQMDGANVQGQGSITKTPRSTTSYRLNIFGPESKSVSRVVTVQVTEPAKAPPPPDAPTFDTLEAVPNLVNQCKLVVLRWTARNTTSVTLEPAMGQAKPSDFRMVKPVQTIRVTLTATGPGGTSSKDIAVTVIPGPLTDCPR